MLMMRAHLVLCFAVYAVLGTSAQQPPVLAQDFIASISWHSADNSSFQATAFAKGDALFVQMEKAMYFQNCLGQLILPNNTGYATECHDETFSKQCVEMCLGGSCCSGAANCQCNMVNYVVVFRDALVSARLLGRCLDGRGDEWQAKAGNGQAEIIYCFSRAEANTPVQIGIRQTDSQNFDVMIDFHDFVHATPPSVLFNVPSDCYCSPHGNAKAQDTTLPLGSLHML